MKSRNTRKRGLSQKKKIKTRRKKNKLVRRMFYCGIRLDDASKSLLIDQLKRLDNKVPKFDHTKCDHVTIGFKRGLLSSEPPIGTKVQFTTNHFGFNDKAIAVKIDHDSIIDVNNGKTITLYPENKLHITLATHKKNNSSESNNITKWNKIDDINLTGTIYEFDSVKGWNITHD
jgi:hypothetical protein